MDIFNLIMWIASAGFVYTSLVIGNTFDDFRKLTPIQQENVDLSKVRQYVIIWGIQLVYLCWYFFGQ